MSNHVDNFEDLCQAFCRTIREKMGAALIADESLQSELADVLGYFAPSVENSYLTLRTLASNAHHGWGADGLVILRRMYELTLQLQYILAVPTERSARAKLYREFAYVEQHHGRIRVDTVRTEVFKRLKESPKRIAYEFELNEKLISMGDTYLTDEGKKILKSSRPEVYLISAEAKYRGKWYKKDIKTIANELGRAAEYDTFYRLCCDYSHANPLAIHRAPEGFSSETTLTHAGRLFIRLFASVGKAFGLTFSDQELKVIEFGEGSLV